MRDEDLWTRLKAHRFPMAGRRRTLRAALRFELGMSAARADRGIEEYRRFLYLSAVAGERLAPSPFIDAVWQVHLGDARAFEDTLALLGRGIDPPRAEPSATDPAYLRTLALYAEEFGAAPFAKVWPSRRMLVTRAVARKAFFATVFLAVAADQLELWWIGGTAFVAAVVFAIAWVRAGPWEAEHSQPDPGEEPERNA